MSDSTLQRKRHIMVGLTAIAAMGSLAFLLVLFGAVPGWLEGGYPIEIQMSHAAGLNKGSRVRLDGVDIGRIDEVTLGKTHIGIVLTARIRDDFRIPVGSAAVVQGALLGSSPALDLFTAEIAASSKPEFLANDGSAQIKAISTSFTSNLEEKLQAALEQPATDLKRLVNSFEKLSSEWANVGKNISDLTEPRTTADVDSNKARANITTVLARADARLAEMKSAMAGLSAILNDDKLRADIKTTIANARQSSEQFQGVVVDLKDAASNAKTFTKRLDASADKVDKLIDTANTSVDQLSKRYVAVADDLAKTIMVAKTLLDQAGTGKGTVGKLINDPSLYNNLNDSVKRLDAALIDLQLLIKKWDKEGLLN
jgi:phospholipid/cholesterol/gamma-HCH transport system substrate-binding protein